MTADIVRVADGGIADREISVGDVCRWKDLRSPQALSTLNILQLLHPLITLASHRLSPLQSELGYLKDHDMSSDLERPSKTMI